MKLQQVLYVPMVLSLFNSPQVQNNHIIYTLRFNIVRDSITSFIFRRKLFFNVVKPYISDNFQDDAELSECFIHIKITIAFVFFCFLQPCWKVPPNVPNINFDLLLRVFHETFSVDSTQIKMVIEIESLCWIHIITHLLSR